MPSLLVADRWNVPVLYEDDFLLFVDKPPGLVVQRNYDPDEPVLIEEVSAILATRGEQAFLLQRLDRGTSGVMFFSKRPEVNPALTRFFEQKRIRKTYVALVHGALEEEQTIDAPLLRIGPISFGVREEGKRAVTIVRPLQRSATASLVELQLLTGRTHQIRVHMAHIGHPLVGDWLYGDRDDVRPMLHSRAIDMPHPKSGAELHVEAPLPDDFLQACHERGVGRGGNGE